MFGIDSLDVMIGVITVYLMFALACTAMVEAITSWLNVRSTNLEAAISEFLHGEDATGSKFVDAFYAHPLVQSLSKGTDGRPSYIDPAQVGRVVTDIILAKEGMTAIKQAIDKLPGTTQDNRIKGLLDSLQSDAKEDIAAFRKLIEHHYDAAMDRASGWYKRKTQTITLIVAATFVIAANVDTLSLANTLSSNPEARARMVEIAQRQMDAANAANSQSAIPATNTDNTTAAAPVTEAKDRTEKAAEALAKANENLTSAGIQLGWQAPPAGFGNWLSKTIGLLVSILAISLGAPFWFDMLSRVMQVRAAGASPREKKAPAA
jgi:hypothetical protein